MKKSLLLAFAGIIGLNFAFAQNQTGSGWCHTHSMSDEFIQNNPQYEVEKAKLNQFRKAYTEQHRQSGNKTAEPLYRIPVVFHVIHEYGTANISEQTILATIKETNDAFRKRNADTSFIQSPFDQIHPDTRIELQLAKIDPNGECTGGINRVYSPTWTNAGGEGMKSSVAPTWDRSKYLNVWVVKTIASGAGGYSFTPPINATSDGIVILAGQLSSLIHELGHYLGLDHPWGPTNDPGVASNCNFDDGVDDTPNTIGAQSCGNTVPNSCPGDPIPFLKMDNTVLWPSSSGELYDNVQNYMGYAFCSAENFTEGQKLWMRGTLESGVSSRDNLWTEANLIATGTTDTSTTGACKPIPDFIYDAETVCQNAAIQFTNFTYNADVDTYSWDFGDGNVSSDENPAHTYTTTGTYTVKLTATNSFGGNTETKFGIITVLATVGGEIAPVVESFENSGFPSGSVPEKDWAISSTTSSKFAVTTAAASSGSKSISLRLGNMPPGHSVELLSPTIDFSDASNCLNLTFKYAYAEQFQTAENDELNVYASKNCGQKWTKVFSRSGSNLSTVNGNFYSGVFVPDSSQWEEANVSLTSVAGQDHILLRIEVGTGSGGNYIYLDDINVGCADITGIEDVLFNHFSIFPNPFDQSATLHIESASTQQTQLTIRNTVGQLLHSEQVTLRTGSNDLRPEILAKLEKGVYFVSLNTQGQNVTRKLIKY